MIWLFLTLSLALNGFFIWYLFNMLRLNALIFENVRLIKERIAAFYNHTTKIYSMAGSEEQNPAMTTEELVRLIKQAHRKPVERGTLYNVIQDYSLVELEA